MKTSIALLSLLLVVAGFMALREPVATPSELRRNKTRAASAHTNLTAVLPPTAVMQMVASSAAAPSGETKSSAASAEIRRYFPSIEHAVVDWRTFNPDTLTVAPYPDLPVTFTRVALKHDGRFVTWIGRIAGIPGASFVGVSTEKGYDAVLVVPGASQFSFHVRGEHAVVTESDPADEGCGLAAGAPVTGSMVSSPGGVYTGKFTGPTGAGPLVSGIPAADSVPMNVDILVAYDASALSVAAAKSSDPAGYIDGLAKATIESCNLVFQNSGVTNFVWRYVGAVQTPAFARTGLFLDDLNALTPGGTLAGWARSMRYEYGADQLLLYVGTAEGPGGRAALQNPNLLTRQTADYSVAVVNIASSFHTMSHELAHNFGCGHDRANYNGTGNGVPEGDGHYNYGLLWTDPFGTSTGTIMSYGRRIIPYFSNPNLTINVTSAMEFVAGPSIDLGTVTIGFPETHPKAAFNARVLTDNAAAMAANTEEITMPVITQQPSGAAVTAGQSLTLSVAAQGGGLTYQWFKGDAALSGANAAVFTKTTALNADAGNYRVQISNRVGAVTSASAAVTVSGSDPATPTPTPTPAPSSSASGGGGGGGAPSGFFYAAVGVLVLARRLLVLTNSNAARAAAEK